MRALLSRSSLLAAAAVALGACGGGAPASRLHAANPAQSVGEGPAAEAQAELGGVVVLVALGGWRGQPRDLEQRLTPADVTVQNRSGRGLSLGPEEFSLLVGSSRYRVLDSLEVTRALQDLSGFRRPPPPVAGARGTGAFPGYSAPPPGDPSIGMRRGQPVPSLEQWYVPQLPSGLLENGRTTSFLLFFGVPLRTLKDVTFEAAPMDEKGEKLGVLDVQFTRD